MSSATTVIEQPEPSEEILLIYSKVDWLIDWLIYFDASTLQEVFTDVSPIVFHRVLIDELLSHNGPLLLEARRAFPFLWCQHSNIISSPLVLHVYYVVMTFNISVDPV